MAKSYWTLRCLCGVFVVAVLVVAPAAWSWAQTASGADAGAEGTPQNVEDVLHQMSDRADIVFEGQVVAIRPYEGETTAAGFVEIDFRVDQTIRGVVGGTYALREWAGLWSGNAYRYKVGQNLLMMLHAPGASGMSSPVGGMDGAIPIRAGGAASMLSAPSTIPSAPVADLRWLGARLWHPANYRLQSVLPATPLTVAQEVAPASVLSSPDELIADPVAAAESSRASVPVGQAPIDTVVKLLASWKKAPPDDVR